MVDQRTCRFGSEVPTFSCATRPFDCSPVEAILPSSTRSHRVRSPAISVIEEDGAASNWSCQERFANASLKLWIKLVGGIPLRNLWISLRSQEAFLWVLPNKRLQPMPARVMRAGRENQPPDGAPSHLKSSGFSGRHRPVDGVREAVVASPTIERRFELLLECLSIPGQGL